MKKSFTLFMALIAMCFSAHGQLTLKEGDTFGYATNWAVGGSGDVVTFWQNGILDVWLDPATVQTGDAIFVELFAEEVGQGLIRSETFVNTNHIAAFAYPFGWWGRRGSFRLTMLSGSVTITNIRASVSMGPFGCPCNYYYSEFIPGPRLQITSGGDNHLRLSWPTNAAGYTLEATPQLPATNWGSVTNEVSTVDHQFFVILSGAATRGFYRLRKP